MNKSIVKTEIAGAELSVVKQTTKTGLTTQRVMGIGEYKAYHSLKGQAAKRSYAQYLKHFGSNGRAGAVAEITRQNMLLTSRKQMSAGKVQYTFAPAKAGEFVEPQPKKQKSPEDILSAMTFEELEALLAQKRAQA